MPNYILHNGTLMSEELYHYGVKGMKWGVRRYQNKDGTLTDKGKRRLAKDLKKDYRRNYDSAMPYKVSDSYTRKVHDAVNRVITDEDKKRILDAKKLYLKKSNEASKAEAELDKLAQKYGRDIYNEELKKNAKIYDTEKSKMRLYDYCVYDYGYDAARKARPDLDKASRSYDSYYDSYLKECRKVSEKLLGSYGDTTLYSSKYHNQNIHDTVQTVVNSMGTHNWQLY